MHLGNQALKEHLGTPVLGHLDTRGTRGTLFSSIYLIMVDYTTQKMKFSIEDFFSKCDQIRRKLRTWSNVLKKSLMEKNFIFCAVTCSFALTKILVT